MYTQEIFLVFFTARGVILVFTCNMLTKKNFCQCDFLSVMDCTVSHTGYMYFGIWMKRNSTWGKQCNNVARKGSSEDKVNKSSIYLFIYFFILTVICVTYHIIYLNKCTLDKIQKRSKIIKNISTLFSLNCLSIKFCEKSRTILKRIIE